MKLQTTLRIFNEAEVPWGPGIVEGQSFKRIAGGEKTPTERIMVGLASFKAGTLEHLHWHLIEVFYFVMSGRAVMTDIEGKTYDIGPGSVVYAPPGIAGSHEWDIKEPLQLISIRASTDPEKNIQFTVDKKTLQSSIDFEYMERRGAVKIKKSLY
jgi:mannose-6-phosphate isomerase-like protein (cupin superfamily)